MEPYILPSVSEIVDGLQSRELSPGYGLHALQSC